MSSGIRIGAIAQNQPVLLFFAIEGPIDEIGIARPRSGSPRTWLMGEDKIVLF